MQPTHIDMFAGVSVFGLAAERAGFRTTAFAETDDFASAVLARRFPAVPNVGDYRALRGGGRVDLVTAGVPCQPASNAGSQLGEADERWHWWGAIATVCDLQPRFAVFENVPGLLSLRRGRTFNGILSRIHEGGYDAWWTHLPACAVSPYHQRDRVFIVAHARSQRRAGLLRSVEGFRGIPHYERPATSLDSRCALVQKLEERLGEPAILGTDDGTPHRSHRLAAVGNSIQLEIAEILLKEIYGLITYEQNT